MYYNGQIVYDLDKKRPVSVGAKGDGQWAWSNLGRTTHFIRQTETSDKFELYVPESIPEAQDLLDKGIIQPSPTSPTHCFNCGNWWSNHNKDGSCWSKS